MGQSKHDKIAKNLAKQHKAEYNEGPGPDVKSKDRIIEAKYNQEMEKKQKDLFEKINIKGKKKIVANGVDFFVK